MLNYKTIIFLILATLFATAHRIALVASLYWYYWWFDILMHFWGGILIGLGIHVLCSFSRINIQPNLLVLLPVVTAVTLSWELFEWSFGLYFKDGYIFDTAIDVFLGFAGGLLAHSMIKTDTIYK